MASGQSGIQKFGNMGDSTRNVDNEGFPRAVRLRDRLGEGDEGCAQVG
jgi:hypothetical protein